MVVVLVDVIDAETIVVEEESPLQIYVAILARTLPNRIIGENEFKELQVKINNRPTPTPA